MAKVTVYSTPTCPYCHMAKAFLKEQKVQFADYDVSEDEGRAREMIEKSGQQGVPVIDIDGEIVVGFDKPRIKELLGIK
ncbi:MAG: glutaredoxin family protein [Candidatus Diapherotrites archaeon]|nr:glutaredoxin family protein [Candidatus Diapherotrites archaeon]